LKVGVENFKKVIEMNPEITIGILTSVPGSKSGHMALQKAIGCNASKRDDIVSRMDKNNSLGKQEWAKKNIDCDKIEVICVLASQNKKEALVSKYGNVAANQSLLLDDYDKNTKIFGKNGYLIESAGDIRLQTWL